MPKKKTENQSVTEVSTEVKPDQVKVKFPSGKIARLVQMSGYIQYHFENGVSGSVNTKEEMKLLTEKWDAQKST